MYYICTRNYKIIGPWCNGNTPVFGTVIQGSSPCGPTKNPVFFKTGFFYFNRFVLLDFKSYHGSFSVIY